MRIISYYTEHPYYAAASMALAINCSDLGLRSEIRQVDMPDRKSATNHKPHFIISTLMERRDPVWWIDVDSRLVAAPPEPEGKWMAVHYQPGRERYPIRASTLFFRPCAQAEAFLKLWIVCGPGKHDHDPLIKAWRKTDISDVALLNCDTWYRNNGFKSLPHPIHG